MKRLLIVAGLLALGFTCAAKEPRVFARYVPERYDDFAFENNLIAGRLYGKALEADVPGGNFVSAGIDIWVKYPGALVADKFYANELGPEKKSYHKNWGYGKDCYKVGKTPGAGASCILIDGKSVMPSSNYTEWKILKKTADKVVFVLTYPEWTVGDVKVSLKKKFTVVPDTHFVQVEDSYDFKGADSLCIVAGVNRHAKLNTIEQERFTSDSYAIWEHASDTGAEPEDGMIGVAVVVPGAKVSGLTSDKATGYVGKKIAKGQKFCYSFGSCWSKADIKAFEDWFKTVDAAKR